MNIAPTVSSQSTQMWTPWIDTVHFYGMREGMTTSKINPLTLTNAIAINMARSMAILTGILLFIINPCYCGDGIRDDVHAMNSRCRNPWFSRSDNLLRHSGCFRNNPLSLLYDEMSGHSRPLVPYFLPTSHWHPYSPIPRLCQTYIRILWGGDGIISLLRIWLSWPIVNTV